MSTRCQDTQINRPVRTLSNLITNFECGNSAHLSSYDIYAVMVLDTYMKSSMNEGKYNTTMKFQCFKCGNTGAQQQLYAVIHIQLHITL
jgi:hypothetical protein